MSGGGSCPCECCDHMPDTDAFLNKFDQGVMSVTLPEWFSTLIVRCNKAILDWQDAPNYVQMEVRDSTTGATYKMVVHRPGRPTDHDMRVKAEAENERIKAIVKEAMDEMGTSSSAHHLLRQIVPWESHSGRSQEVEQ